MTTMQTPQQTDPFAPAKRIMRHLPASLLDDRQKLLDFYNAKIAGKTPKELDTIYNQDLMGTLIDETTVHHFAADYIERKKAEGDTMTPGKMLAVTDMYRQLGNLEPVFYNLGREGAAVPKDFFTEKRLERTGNSGWANFTAHLTQSAMSQAGGIAQFGARITDAVGVTDHATQYWQDQMAEVQRITGAQAGTGAMAGQLAGNLMFSLMVGGTGLAAGGGKAVATTRLGRVGASLTKARGATKGLAKSVASGWKGALTNVVRESGGVGLAFGMSETGRRFGDLDKRIKDGADISLTDQLTYAVGGGLVEGATEMFGWGVAKGFGRNMLKLLPNMRTEVAAGGVKGGVKWGTSLLSNFMKQATRAVPQGATEELMAQYGANLVDKFTGVVPDDERPDGLATGLKEAAIMGALMPLTMGTALASANTIQLANGQKVAVDANQKRSALLQQKRDIQKNPGLSTNEKQELLGPIEEALSAQDRVLNRLLAENKSAIEQTLPTNAAVREGFINPRQEAFNQIDLLQRKADKATTPKTKKKYNDQIAAIRKQVDDGTYKISNAHIGSKLANEIRNRYKFSDEPAISKVTETGIKTLMQDSPLLDWASQYHNGQIRIDRLLEGIDGGPNGRLQEMIYRPVDTADQVAWDNQAAEERVFQEKFGDPATLKDIMLTPQPPTDLGLGEDKRGLSSSEKIGISMMAMQGDVGMGHLTEGNQYTEAEVQNIINSLTPKEIELRDHMLEYYNRKGAQAIELAKTYLGVDINPMDLWAPIQLLKGTEPDADVDYTTSLLETFAKGENIPEHGFVKKRTGGNQPVDIDAVSTFLHNIHRLERFNAMLPAAKEVGGLLNNPKLREAMNKASRGTATKILDKWLQDSVKGQTTNITSWVGKQAEGLRRNATAYIAGFNLLMASRQPIAALRLIADSPKTGALFLKNLIKVGSQGNFNSIKAQVYKKSRMMRTRSPERYFVEQLSTTPGTSVAATQKSLRRRAKATYRQVSGKKALNEQSFALLKNLDQYTAVVGWQAAYEAAKADGLAEADAIKHADKRIERLQAAGRTPQLPDMFRGGVFERMITTFQNETNQNYNFITKDLIGATARKEISVGKAAYRFLVGHVVPALMMGIISRGRLQDDWGEAAKDVGVYTLSPALVLGQGIASAWEGYADLPMYKQSFRHAWSAATNIMDEEKPVRDILVPTIKAIGSITGQPWAQPIRTAEGVIDLAEGETEDIRRVIYSKYAIEQSEAEREENKRKGEGFGRF